MSSRNKRNSFGLTIAVVAVLTLIVPPYAAAEASTDTVNEMGCSVSTDRPSDGEITAACCCSIGDTSERALPAPTPGVAESPPDSIPAALPYSLTDVHLLAPGLHERRAARARAPPPCTLLAQRTSLLR